MHINQLETPALILDLDLFEHNINTINKMLEGSHMKMRPHYKSNKCPAVAKLQLAAGAKGITCAKLTEAEDLIFAGVDDILIANQITEKSKITRVAYLAGCCHLVICVDDEQNILDLQEAAKLMGTTIYCYVEYNIGRRCGVDTKEDFLKLAKLVDSCPNLVFEGMQAYAGHLSHETNYEVRKKASEDVEKLLTEVKEYTEANGLPVKEVSGASTGTVQFRPKDSVYTEVQAGSYIFMDTAYGELNLDFKNSLFVLTTVMHSSAEKMLTDAGRKSASVDQKDPVFREFPDLPAKVTEEHSCIYQGLPVKVGDKLMLIPGHCCTTVNLHDNLYFVRNGKVVDRFPISGRGKSI